ncbi:MAG: nucleotidyltransferase [Lachnospiraceae bacterium]|nr:nucleotidyltransferase [Lachnospiraceae bacterium]
MKVNGIIAEYNPFHNGHHHQMNDAKAFTGADYTIIAMSGDFVQRGAPALINKYKRTEMALRNGADLVLELPSYYAISSAEYFATGAVSLLDKLGVVTHLCFGSECGNLAVLQQIADILLTEPEHFSEALRENLRQGLSYPTARTSALLQYDTSLSVHKDVLSSPNNILGIEYMKALRRRNSSIVPFTTIRVGNDYHDRRLGQKQSSALAIRHAILSRTDTEYLQDHMPESAHNILSACLESKSFLYSDDFSAILHYKLLREAENGFTQYLDVSSELSDRIRKNLYQYNGFKSFCDLLKSKDMTYTRISRCLLHILLDMKTDVMEQYRAMDYIPYARVLGFRKESTPLLTAIGEHSSIPLITKLADAQKVLSAESLEMLQQDILRTDLYESTIALKSGLPMANEYRTPIVIL